MTQKASILTYLGDRALALPALLDAALAANDRAKYVLAMLQLAAAHASNPMTPAPDLKSDREACGIADPGLDRCIARSEGDGCGFVHVPGLRKLMAILREALSAMLAPLEAESEEAAAPYAGRLENLLAACPDSRDETIDETSIAAMTSGRPAGGDGIHLLVMALHKEILRLQGALATETVGAVQVYGVEPRDRPLIAAFDAGVARTRGLKFDHPGLAAMATRSNGKLLIQNDIGTTDAHVLVIAVDGASAVITHTDVHLQRLRFFQDLLAEAGIAWDPVRSEQRSGLAEGDLFYVARGVATTPDAAALAERLGLIGSRLVFLIDWNKARKRLGLLVPNDTAIDILAWAAREECGHYAFLALGGERLIYDALEQAVRTPLRYGELLHEMIGLEPARDYLRYALQTCSKGLAGAQSAALISDQLRAELFNHFRSAEQRLLDDAARHARIVLDLAEALAEAVHHPAGGALERNALQAKRLESKADEIVRTTRQTVRRISGTEMFGRLVQIADDAADALEEAAFLGGLLARAGGAKPPEPLIGLAELLVDAATSYCEMVEAAAQVRRGGPRETMRGFLEAVDRVAIDEHRTDEQERLVTLSLIEGEAAPQLLYLIGGMAAHLEEAADALARAALTLRDHVLGDVMSA